MNPPLIYIPLVIKHSDKHTHTSTYIFILALPPSEAYLRLKCPWIGDLTRVGG